MPLKDLTEKEQVWLVRQFMAAHIRGENTARQSLAANGFTQDNLGRRTPPSVSVYSPDDKETIDLLIDGHLILETNSLRDLMCVCVQTFRFIGDFTHAIFVTE